MMLKTPGKKKYMLFFLNYLGKTFSAEPEGLIDV